MTVLHCSLVRKHGLLWPCIQGLDHIHHLVMTSAHDSARKQVVLTITICTRQRQKTGCFRDRVGHDAHDSVALQLREGA
jgi:hypothetical protein